MSEVDNNNQENTEKDNIFTDIRYVRHGLLDIISPTCTLWDFHAERLQGTEFSNIATGLTIIYIKYCLYQLSSISVIVYIGYRLYQTVYISYCLYQISSISVIVYIGYHLYQLSSILDIVYIGYRLYRISPILDIIYIRYMYLYWISSISVIIYIGYRLHCLYRIYLCRTWGILLTSLLTRVSAGRSPASLRGHRRNTFSSLVLSCMCW